MGRRPIPNEIKKLSGSRHYNPDAPKPQMVTGLKVPWGLPRYAKLFWKETAPALERMGVLTEVDIPAFTACALNYHFMKEAAVVLQRDGLIQDGTKGERKAPAWQIYRDAFMAFMKSAGEFGLTPAARSNLKVDDGGLVDEFFGY